MNIFIESTARQANKIAKISGKPVIYYQSNSEIIYPNKLKALQTETISNTKQFFDASVKFAIKGFNKLSKLG
jgi:hypothetical protein